MGKAISNLISNAFKFTPEEGKITVDVSMVSAGQVIVRVTDTGKGIAPDKMEHIFDRFYQAEKDAQSTGFGIGLAIAREIVLLHGGKICVNSEAGRGSEFSIVLPEGKDHFENVEFVDSPPKDMISEHFIRDDRNGIPDPVPEEEVKECSFSLLKTTSISEPVSPNSCRHAIKYMTLRTGRKRLR
jgi:hypothetical protein